MTWPILSKTVGWTPRNIPYPSYARITYLTVAIERQDFNAMIELLTYQRFLQKPKTTKQHRIMAVITYLVLHLRKDILK